jgi:hypothetical protein
MPAKTVKVIVIVTLSLILVTMALMWDVAVVPDIVAILISTLGLLSVVLFYKESPSAGVYVLATVGFAIAFSKIGLTEGRPLAVGLAVVFGLFVALQPVIGPWLDEKIREIDERYANRSKGSKAGSSRS